MPLPATTASGYPIGGADPPSVRCAGAQRIPPPSTLDRGLCAVVAAAPCSPRPRRGAPAWPGSSPVAGGAAAATACPWRALLVVLVCAGGGRRRRCGSWWIVITTRTCVAARQRASPPRGRGATRPGCGSCSTSAAAQPIRGRGSHASYGRPRAQATVKSVRVGRVARGARRALRSAGRHADPDLRDAAGHDRRCPSTTRTARRASPGRRTCACRACAPASRSSASCSRARRAPRCSAPTAGCWRPTRRRAAIAGRAPSGSDRGTGLERLYDERLAGRPGRSCASATASSPRSSAAAGARSTPRSGPGCSAPPPRRSAASSAASPSCARATARSSPSRASPSPRPQPPGSTFKIVTLSGALAAGVATPSSSYPVRTSATLSGVKLRNAGGESCGGSLTQAFIDSCNSVFAPLGAKLGAKRLVRMAEAFGFNERPRVPDAKASTIPPAGKLTDSLAVGAERDRPGPRSRDAAADGRAWGRRSPSAAAARARASCATTRSCAVAWSARASPGRCAR